MSTGSLLLGYFTYRLKLSGPPDVARRYDALVTAIDGVCRYGRRTRVRGAEHCPRNGPAVFAGNHIGLDDPFLMGCTIYFASERNIRPRIMMRDDFFTGFPRWLRRCVDPDEVLVMMGAVQISRGRVEPGQLQRFVELLTGANAFLIYPGRTRTRSGLFMEYRDWFRTPGAVSFFVAQAQRAVPGLRVPVAPVVRTYNPVNGTNALVFGEGLHLPPDADREAQRAFDYRLVTDMAGLVEINVPQLVSVWLYLHCLHRGGAPVSRARLADTIARIAAEVPHLYIDPAARGRTGAEVGATLRFLRRHGLLGRKGDTITPQAGAVLAMPSQSSACLKTHPLRYLCNQILHLRRVTGLVEQAVLE